MLNLIISDLMSFQLKMEVLKIDSRRPCLLLLLLLKCCKSWMNPAPGVSRIFPTLVTVDKNL